MVGAFSSFFTMIAEVAKSMMADQNITLYIGIFLGLGVIGGIFSIVRR